MTPGPEPVPREGRLSASGALPRFGLLLVLLSSSVVTLVDGHPATGTVFGDPQNNTLGCAFAAGFDPAGTFEANYAAFSGNEDALRTCTERFGLAWWVSPAAVLGVLLLAALLWWVMPVVTARRARLRRVTDPDLRRELAALVTAAGPPREPRFLVDPAGRVTATTFGRPGRYTVALGSGLLVAPEPVRRAVVLHELAHLRNRDVGITLATVALWRVFAVVMLVPYLAGAVNLLVSGQFYDGGDPTGAYYSAGTAPGVQHLAIGLATAALVFLTRVDVMRSREFDADRLAVRRGADAGLWAPAAGRRPAGPRWRERLRRLGGTHPSWAVRRAALDDPRGTLRPGSLQAFLTGAASILVVTAVRYTTVPGLDVAGIGTVAAGGLAGGIVGVALWRSGGRDAGDGRPQGVRTGLWLGAGLAAGALLVDQPFSPSGWLPPSPPAIVVLALAAASVTVWTAHALRVLGDRFPAAAVLVVGVTAALLAFALQWYSATSDLLRPGMARIVVEAGQQGTVFGTGPASTLVVLVFLLGNSLGAIAVWPATGAWLVSLLLVTVRTPGALRRRLVAAAARGTAGSLIGCVALVLGAAALGVANASIYLIVLVAVACAGPRWAAVTSAGGEAGAVRGLAAGGLSALVLGLLLLAAIPALALLDPGVGRYTALVGSVAGLLRGYLVLGLLMAVAVVATLTVRRRVAAPHVADDPVGTQAVEPARTLGPGRRRWGAAGSVGVAVLLTAALLVVSGGAAGAAGPATAVQADGREAATVPQVRDPNVRKAQATAWLRYGGLDLVHQWVDAMNEIAGGLDRVVDDLSDREPLRLACVHAGDVARASRAYFRVQDPELGPAWTDAADRAERGADECVRGLAADDQELLSAGIGDIDDASRARDSVNYWYASVLEG